MSNGHPSLLAPLSCKAILKLQICYEVLAGRGFDWVRPIWLKLAAEFQPEINMGVSAATATGILASFCGLVPDKVSSDPTFRRTGGLETLKLEHAVWNPVMPAFY